jgi:geranylgeranylglycerol-phosphate geranylgeranyltransferase
LQDPTSVVAKARALISMVRLPNCIMIGFAVIVGEAIASSVVPAIAAFFGFWTGFLFSGSSMVLNDYFDLEIDLINDPARPIPSGLVRPSEAVSFAIVLASIGLLCATITGVLTLVIAVASMILTVAYNSRFKKTGLVGNGMVSTNVAVPFIYGGSVVGNVSWPLFIFALLAFLSSLGREIVKGIVDVAGDKKKGVNSIAVTRGNDYAAKGGAAFFLLSVGLSALPLALHMVSPYYVPLVIICDFGFLLTSYSIMTNPTPRNAKRNKKYVLIWMTFGLLAFVVGTL